MEVITYTHEGLVMFLKELGIQLTKPTLHLLAWLMVALLEKTAAHLFRLAEELPDDDTTDMARRQKVRRFMSNPRIFPYLFLHAIVSLIRPLFQNASVLELVLDRTEWIKRRTPVNILDVALSYKGRSIPLFWLAFNRRGSSSLQNWKAVLTPVIETLRAASWSQGKQIHVTADREFASPKLSQWLWMTFRVGSTIRMKRSEYINSEPLTATIRGKRTTGLFLVGLSAFTRILRSTCLERIQRFFYRLFVGWMWPHRLEILFQNQKC